jgi:glycosyltransferase involved in cell wall biosynthesis
VMQIRELGDFIKWKKRGIYYRAGLVGASLKRKAGGMTTRGLTRAQCARLWGRRPRVATGWTGDVVGGVKNHLLAIRRHSAFKLSLLPSNACISIAAFTGLTGALPATLREKDLARFDVVHSHVEPFFIELCARVAKRDIPWVHTYHTVYFPEDWAGALAPWQKEINRCLIQTAPRANVRIAVSRWLQEYLHERHSIQTVYVPNGVDIDWCRNANAERFVARYGLRRFALFVGTGDDIKNPDAFVRLAAYFPTIDFVMIGRRLSPESLRHKLGTGLPDNLRVLGTLPHSCVLDAIAECRVFVMTSRSEGLPTVLMEAMALGKPVVGCNRFGVKEAIGDERCGFIYDLEDMSDLRHKFSCALEDKLRGNAAKARVESEYAWPVVIRKLDQIYTRLL